MRLFLALPLSDEQRAELTAMQERLKVSGADVRWVEPESFSLSVFALGDRDDSLLPHIEAACADVALETAPFRMRLRGASYLPKRGPAVKTLYASAAEGTEAWKALAKRAEEPLRVFSIPRGNDLAPHVTLGRVKGERGMAELRAAVAAESEADCGAFLADQMTLVQTLLDPAGAVYRDVTTWRFAAANV